MPTATKTERRTTAKRAAPESRATTKERRAPNGEHGLAMHTVDVNAPLHIPYLTPRDMLINARAATTRLPVKALAFYGGLGAMAVAGALDWPVALAVAGATAVVRGRERK